MHHSLHDSDVLIVQTAIASARNKSTVVIEKKTPDFLIIVLHYVGMEADDLSLAQEPHSHQLELGT